MYKISGSTMGQSSLASIAEDTREPGRDGLYHRKGDLSWFPGRDREPAPELSPDSHHQRRIDRINAYCEHRAEGKSRREAERLVRVGRSAGKEYESEYKARQQGGPS